MLQSLVKRSLIGKLCVFSLFLLAVGCGEAQNKPVSEVYAPGNQAINGYDPVAFFTDSMPVKGSNSYSYNWNGADWLFSSADNLDKFKADPDKYAPQYGGYCAYGTSQGHKAPTKPETWTIVNGKLYFNYNNDVKKKWTADRDGLIEKADANWPTVKTQKE
jgi:YHS domain-containing protein